MTSADTLSGLAFGQEKALTTGGQTHMVETADCAEEVGVS